jgi:hypothetical protein
MKARRNSKLSSVSLCKIFGVVICVFLLINQFLVNLLSVGASLCETCLSAGGLTEHDVAVPTQNNRLGMTEDCGNLKASWTLDVHEETVRGLNKPLQLVCACFLLCGRM